MKPSSDRLPFGSEFSPSQIDLGQVLSYAEKHQGDCRALQKAIQTKYFSKHSEGNAKNQETLAMNCRLAMQAYGILDRTCQLTKFGNTLFALRDKPAAMYRCLAVHILLNLHGLNLLQCIRDMNAAHRKVTLPSLRESLAERGIEFPSGGKHPSMMRLWLVKAGVFAGERWQIREDVVADLIGGKTEDFAVLQGLTEPQRAFLRALANIGSNKPQMANQVAKLAATTFGVRFPEKSLPAQILEPLKLAGYLTLSKTTSGRGAKPFMVAGTDKLNAEVLVPMLAQLERQTDPKVIGLLRLSMDDILMRIASEDRHTSGLALEALAFKLMRSLEMDYKSTRLRAAVTGGAEVDLIFESTRLVFSRWQVQCKNTARVSLDDVAKEVGLTHLLKSSVIVVVTTGRVGDEARRYADRIMKDSNLSIVMLEGRDLDRIATQPAYIVDVFSREARHASGIKILDLAK
jgi:site-specific DNA-methyltransferase (cytosine-N4-specific)